MATPCTTNETEERLLAKMPNPFYQEIAAKIVQGKRLSREEGLRLIEEDELEALQALADYDRKKRVGDTVYFASTLFIHPTNLCELSCPFCSFYAKPGWESAWFLTPQQIEDKVRKYYDKGLTEVHFVGGLWRDCTLDYYQDAFTRIKQIDPNLHIKALTAVEYDFLAKLHQISVEEVFTKMIGWGLGSLPGGGAEILVEKVRKLISPQKITSEEYLDIHERAHKLGLKSNITMLFGHIEEYRDIIEHLCKVREIQDTTGGIQTFVPLKYHEENNALGKRKNRIKPKHVQKVYALSRLMLDNVRNLKILWNYVGVAEGQELLKWGGNDLASTALDEKIIVMAGGVQVKMTRDYMQSLISEVGRIPKEINSGYDYTREELA